MNLTTSWDAGINGEGIHVALIDDGLDYEHDDLRDNFVSLSSRIIMSSGGGRACELDTSNPRRRR